MLDDETKSFTVEWKRLSEDEARDPMSAIYDVELEISDLHSALNKAQEGLDRKEKRLGFLREVAKARLGLDQ